MDVIGMNLRTLLRRYINLGLHLVLCCYSCHCVAHLPLLESLCLCCSPRFI